MEVNFIYLFTFIISIHLFRILFRTGKFTNIVPLIIQTLCHLTFQSEVEINVFEMEIKSFASFNREIIILQTKLTQEHFHIINIHLLSFNIVHKYSINQCNSLKQIVRRYTLFSVENYIFIQIHLLSSIWNRGQIGRFAKRSCKTLIAVNTCFRS
jgi:hypothetical protein